MEQEEIMRTAILLAVASMGCAQPYVVLHQSLVPPPQVPVEAIAILPVDFRAVNGSGAFEYTESIERSFREGLDESLDVHGAPSGPPALVLQPWVTSFSPEPEKELLRFRVALLTPQGALIDEIAVRAKMESCFTCPPPGAPGGATNAVRARTEARSAALVIGRYLRFRLEGQDERSGHPMRPKSAPAPVIEPPPGTF